MSSLPTHGRVDCTMCFRDTVPQFDHSYAEGDGWRIKSNPLSWGNDRPEVVVLGFSKGPTQSGALAQAHHDHIAYKGSRTNVGKILRHVGLLPGEHPAGLSAEVDALISNPSGRFHFASLIRCTVERLDPKSRTWKGSGGGMLDRFIATEFGRRIASNCTTRFLSGLPETVKLIVMFGMGTKLNYVRTCYDLIKSARPGPWRWINDVAYSDGKVTVVHVEHFAAQGRLIPEWLGERSGDRVRYGNMARSAIDAVLVQRLGRSDA